MVVPDDCWSRAQISAGWFRINCPVPLQNRVDVSRIGGVQEMLRRQWPPGNGAQFRDVVFEGVQMLQLQSCEARGTPGRRIDPGIAPQAGGDQSVSISAQKPRTQGRRLRNIQGKVKHGAHKVAERVEWQPRRRQRVEPHMRFRNQRQDDFGRDMSVRSDCWFVQNTLRQPSLTCLSRIAQGFGGGVPGRSDGQNDIDIHFAFS